MSRDRDGHDGGGAGALRALVRGAVIWGALLVAISEILGAFSLLATGPVAIAWGATLLAIAAVRRDSIRRSTAYRPRFHPDGEPLAYAIAAAVIFLVTGYLAVAASPAASDAMTYHLPRVAHWIQDRSLALYPTNVDRQLWLGPGAELITLHLVLLTGSFFLVNVPQWIAFVACGLLASLIAKQLGASDRGQMVACIVCITTPIAVAEASGSQVDLVASFWMLCLTSLMLEERTTEEASWFNASFIGGAAGLAVLTKAIAFLFLAPFGLWYLIILYQRHRGSLVKPVLVAAVVAIAVNAGYFARNTALYHTPLGPRGYAGLGNNSHSPRAVASNAVRNVASQFGTGWQTGNEAVLTAVRVFHRAIGIGVNDGRTTFPRSVFRQPALSYGEGDAGNPLHWILGAIVFVALLARSPQRWSDPQFLAIALAVTYLIYCFFLKWQPWAGRLLLPILFVGAPLIGYALDSMARPVFTTMISAILVAATIPVLLFNPARSLVGEHAVWKVSRDSQLVAPKFVLHTPVIRSSLFLASTGCNRIGLYIGANGWEYPWWTVGRPAGELPEIREVNVINVSSKTATASDRAFTPCAIVDGDYDPDMPVYSPPPGFRLAHRDWFVKIYQPVKADSLR